MSSEAQFLRYPLDGSWLLFKAKLIYNILFVKIQKSWFSKYYCRMELQMTFRDDVIRESFVTGYNATP
jgi:hypothetical protein